MKKKKENPIKRLFVEQLKIGQKEAVLELDEKQEKIKEKKAQEERLNRKSDLSNHAKNQITNIISSKSVLSKENLKDEDDWDPTDILNNAVDKDTFKHINHLHWIPPKDLENYNEDYELYNPDADLSDEDYVNKNYRVGDKWTDSVLCCAGCFTPVCYQCQRHELYVHQYRALSAVNCEISSKKSKIARGKNENHFVSNKERKIIKEKEKEEENLIDVFLTEKMEQGLEKNNNINKQEDDRKEEDVNNMNNTRKTNFEEETKETHENINEKRTSEEELELYSVYCTECDNEIAVYDKNKEIYYFYDVFPGEP